MAAEHEEYKGRAEEAAGDLADDEQLKREGKVDQAKSKVKEAVDEAAERVKDTLNRNS